MWQHAHRLWPLMPLILVGCSDPLPIEHETVHLRIGSELEGPLCNGDLQSYESLIEDVEQELDLEMKGVTTVYIWSDDAWWSGANRACPDDSNGCYNKLTKTVNTVIYSLEHEIVHAAVGGDDVGPFLGEAIANVYSGDQSRFGETFPSENIDLPNKSIDHITATHFVRWLRERWGPEKLGQILAASGPGSELFDEVYGISVEEAEGIYFEEAPYQYTSLHSCKGASLQQSAPAASVWREEITLDCPNGDDTRTSGVGMIVHRTFEIPESGYYTVHHDGYWFDIYRCSPERIEEAFYPNTHLYDDVPPEHGGFPSGGYRHYEGQSSWSLYMEAGKHDIGVGLLGHDAGSVTLEITPTLDQYPVPPN